MSECWALEKKEKLKSKATLVLKKTEQTEGDTTARNKSHSMESIANCEPFISHGLVSLVREDKARSVCVLRDTRDSQSLLLEGVLHLSESSYTGSNVLLQGVELGVISVLLR